ncbi:hypothetical protein SDC9_53986 [bioreactor metagenome]|uniref:site-specific DNA-methyltransferase (adenine-specific) n=1 Tax=bioreactor metagenome TaxID=1076179 RepID=A0A644WV80_9ZZZZ
MIDKNSQKSELSLLRSAYEQVGITDPLTIIEHTAFFMLSKQLGAWQRIWNNVVNTIHESSPETQVDRFGFSLPLADIREKFSLPIWETDIEKLLPDPPDRLNSGAVKNIMDAAEIFFGEQSLSELFNRTLLFQFEKMQTGGRYPTPRHLSDWAASIINIRPNDSIADFACGSGGFLVAAAEKSPQVTGVEISPNWARLAFTNCLLHNIEKPDIRIGNSLSIFGKRENEKKFDCILMNPPFGAKVDESQVNNAFDFKLSGRSETVLTALACERLSENGQMVVFLPSGSLFANNSGEQILREEWIENGELSAVISFPKDSFQPYSQTPTHALVIEKRAHPDYVNWFFRPRYDGFTSGRNRQPDPENNDLPLIQTALQERKTVSEYWMNPGKHKGLMGEVLFRNDKLIGYRIVSQEASQLKIKKLSSEFPFNENQFLAEIQENNSTNYMLLNQVEHIYGKIEDSIPIIPTPLTLNENIRVEFAEEWDFLLELTPQGGTYIETLTKKTSNLTFTKIDFSKTIGILINPDGSPLTPAFTLPKTFDDTNVHIYNWYEETESSSGVLLTIPPKPRDSLAFLDSKGRKTHLIKINDESILALYLDENQTSHFSVFKVTNIRLSNGAVLGCVLDPEGVVIGIAIPFGEIQKKPNLDLQPISYFLQQDEMELRVLDSPAQILAEIQQSQNALTSQIKKLLNLSEMVPASSFEIPPETIFAKPIGKLLGFQKNIWDAIQTKVEHFQGKNIPIPFQLEDLDLPYSLPDIERTVNLFEQMGMVVKVSIMDVPYYRLLSTRETRTEVES